MLLAAQHTLRVILEAEIKQYEAIQEKPFDKVVITGTGNAISKAVTTSNIIRGKILGLYM